LRVCERIIEAKDALEMTKDEVLAAASRAASKMAVARVKRLEGDVEIWRREQRSNYASIAGTNLRFEIARVQKEIELDAMRKKNDPRITERARREEEYNASLHKTRQQVDTLKVHILEVRRERDKWKEKSVNDERKKKNLQSEVQHLKGMEEKAAI